MAKTAGAWRWIPLRMCCSIYDQRPAICRKFAMGSEYCRDEREIYRTRYDQP